MKITSADMNEVVHVAGLLKQIDALNPDTLIELADEILEHQPFFLSVMLGYYEDTTLEELEEIMRIYMLTWKYFSSKKNMQVVMVTEQDFERTQKRNLDILKYVEGEPDSLQAMNIYTADLANLKSKTLFTAILYWHNERPVLVKMDSFKKSMVLIGIKTFIEIFEKM
jgi:hypothetical protein